jgi:hypothetical protein
MPSARLGLLPADAQLHMRDLFRRYLGSRTEAYQRIPDVAAVNAALAKSANLQSEIWTLAVFYSREAGTFQAPILLLPALNAMFDIRTTRTQIVLFHPPRTIYAMLAVLAFAPSFFAGYDMAMRRKLNVLHSLAFAAVFSVTSYPRQGLIKMTEIRSGAFRFAQKHGLTSSSDLTCNVQELSRTTKTQKLIAYWVGLYDSLESRGFKVYVVDAHTVRHLPGRSLRSWAVSNVGTA